MPETIARNLKVKGMRSFPGVLLAQLANLVSLRGQGFGEFLLRNALLHCLEAAQHVGAVAVVTDPIDEEAESFYRKYDFIRLEDNKPRMILPMRTIAKAYAPAVVDLASEKS